jgi:hypothetical protein
MKRDKKIKKEQKKLFLLEFGAHLFENEHIYEITAECFTHEASKLQHCTSEFSKPFQNQNLARSFRIQIFNLQMFMQIFISF